jgi:hypothetical protein
MEFIETLAQLLYDTDWATAIRESEIVFPAIETVHVLALGLMAGTIAVVDLRLLGAALRDAPALEVERRIVPVTWAGFAVMAITGLLLFVRSGQDHPQSGLHHQIRGHGAGRGQCGAVPLAGAASPVGRSGGRPVPVPAQVGRQCRWPLWLVVIAAGRAIAYF